MNKKELWTGIGLTLALFVLGFFTQKLISLNGGAGWDGAVYVEMAAGGINAILPFRVRIGYPFLARVFSFWKDPVLNFKLLSVILGVLYSFFSYVFLYKLFPHVPKLIRILGWAFLNLTELAPGRISFWYPAYTDIPANLLFLGLLATCLSESLHATFRNFLLGLIFFLGILIRENFLVNFGLVILLYLLDWREGEFRFSFQKERLKPVLSSFAGLFLGLLTIKYVTHLWIFAEKEGVMELWLKYFKFATVLQAVLAIYGFLLLLLAASIGLKPKWLPKSKELLLFLACTIPIGLTGGGNIERQLFWYSLIVVLFAIPCMVAIFEKKRWIELGLVVLYYALIHRFFFSMNTMQGVSYDSGCKISDWLRGGSPHLMTYSLICKGDKGDFAPPFILLYLVFLGLILALRVRFEGIPRLPNPLPALIKNRTKILIFSVVSVFTWFFPLFLLGEIDSGDWSYFNALGALVRSLVFSYHRFPNHDPWALGGINLLANPQNRIFSPLGLLDLYFVPEWSYLLGFILYSFLGLWGMYTLLKNQKSSEWVSIFGSILFINSTWFGLHLAAGHMPYAAIQLLPWTCWLFLNSERPKNIPLLGLLLGFFLLDGGIYAFIYSLLLIASLILFGIKPLGAFWADIKNRPWIYLLSAMGSFLVAFPKILPLYLDFYDRVPFIDYFSVPFKSMAYSLFWPYQRRNFHIPGFAFHLQEFGCYLGWFPFLFSVYFIAKNKEFFKANLKYFALILFWFWVGSGWLPWINPWKLFHHIPFANNAHIQSRVWIMMDIFFLVIFCQALSSFLASPLKSRLMYYAVGAALAFTLFESFVAKNYPFLDYKDFNRQFKLTNQLITSTTLEETVAFGQRPQHYYNRNKGAKHTYEVSGAPTAVLASFEKNYRGEIYLQDKSGKAQIDSYIPNELVFTAEASRPDIVVINTNDLGYWKVVEGTGEIISKKREILRVRIPAGKSHLKLRYFPTYLPGMIVAEILGLIMLFGLLLHSPKTNPRSA